MKRTTVFLIIICLALPAGIALSGQSTESVFKQMDQNGDNVITSQEYTASCRRGEKECMDEFKWFDRNKDGRITLPEYEGKMNE